MKKYNDYIKGLKKGGGGADFDQLRTGVEMRIGQSRARRRLAAIGTLVIFIMAAAVSYLYLPSITGGEGDMLLSYVFESGSGLDGPMLDYVLSE